MLILYRPIYNIGLGNWKTNNYSSDKIYNPMSAKMVKTGGGSVGKKVISGYKKMIGGAEYKQFNF